MYPVFFHIGKVNFYTHGLMIALGAILGGLVIYFLAKKENLPIKFLFDLLVFSLFLGIIGARIFYVIFYWHQFSNFLEMLEIWYGGLVSFGGIIFGFLMAYAFLKGKNQPILKWFDLGIIGLLFGWAVARVGCFLSGDVSGISSFSKIAIWNQVPVALLESIWALILGVVLLILYQRRAKIIAYYPDGLVFFAGIAGYSVGRFVIDFWRFEPVLYLLKGGQIFSLLIFLGAIYFCYKILRSTKGEQYA